MIPGSDIEHIFSEGHHQKKIEKQHVLLQAHDNILVKGEEICQLYKQHCPKIPYLRNY